MVTRTNTRSHIDEFAPRIASLERICEEPGRDPASIGRGAGLSVHPLEKAGTTDSSISGSADEIADSLRTFRDAGFASSPHL
jgi:hypothetical protein